MSTAKVLVTDLSSTVEHIPQNFIRPVSDRPNLADIEVISEGSIPLIELEGLYGPNRADIIKQIRLACEQDGIFQVKNHGIPESRIKDMFKAAREYFRLPEEERMKAYSDDHTKSTRLSTSFNVKTEKLANWRDTLRLHCYPLDKVMPEWPTNPPSFRRDVAEYSTSARKLALELVEAITESLGLEKNYIIDKMGEDGHHMGINYYPPCPQPELTYGVPGHCDSCLLTILLQDDVPGLQILKDSKWVTIKPISNTLTINLGDQMRVISNDRFKSILHRAIVHSKKERMSIPTFYGPSPDSIIGPAPELVDEDHHAAYRDYLYSDYFDKFWSGDLSADSKSRTFKASSTT